MKNYSNFAASYIRNGGMNRLLLTGIFCACTLHIYGSVPPRKCVMQILPFLGVGQRERLNRFSFSACNKTNLSVMSYTEKTCLRANNSIPQSTQTERNTVSIEALSAVSNADTQVFQLPSSIAEIQPILMLLKENQMPVILNINITTNNNMKLGNSHASNISLVTADGANATAGHQNQLRNGNMENENHSIMEG